MPFVFNLPIDQHVSMKVDLTSATKPLVQNFFPCSLTGKMSTFCFSISSSTFLFRMNLRIFSPSPMLNSIYTLFNRPYHWIFAPPYMSSSISTCPFSAILRIFPPCPMFNCTDILLEQGYFVRIFSVFCD